MKPGEERDRLRAAAFRLLRYRERSVAEMRARLLRKGFDREAIDREIADLISEKLLDDERFAGVWIRHKLCISHKGKRLIRAELAAKGIPSDLFNRVWTEYTDREITSAREYAETRAKGFNHLDSFERRGRIRQALYRRGYSMEAITEALKEIE
jgi:regulatory protein